ncbi:hypothetical protein ACVMB0_007297 [Bradyrhizobium sp. USDA 4451]
MKQQRVVARQDTMPTYRFDQFGRIPLVNNHQSRAIESAFEIEAGMILPDIDSGQQSDHFLESPFAAVLKRVEPAPAVDRLVDDDVVPARIELAGDSAEKVRIAVVPA